MLLPHQTDPYPLLFGSHARKRGPGVMSVGGDPVDRARKAIAGRPRLRQERNRTSPSFGHRRRFARFGLFAIGNRPPAGGAFGLTAIRDRMAGAPAAIGRRARSMRDPRHSEDRAAQLPPEDGSPAVRAPPPGPRPGPKARPPHAGKNANKVYTALERNWAT